MIAWLQPAALWGLALVSIPLLIHLLRMRRAARVPFPSLRFVRPAPVAAVRVGRPADLVLLVLRMAIVACAVLALARPVVLSGSRLAAWNARVARAVVVDVSDSLGLPSAEGRAARLEAAAAAAAESKDAAFAYRIDSSNLADGVRRAVARLRTAPPARREIVVISDFQQGALSAHALEAVPAAAGVRHIKVGTPARARQVDGVSLMGASGVAPRAQSVRLEFEATRVSVEAGELAAQGGLRVIGASDPGDEESLRRAVALAGAVAPSAEEPIAVRLSGKAAAETALPLRERWMLDVAIRLERDPGLHRLALASEADRAMTPDAGTILLHDRLGRPLLRAGALGRELLLDAAAPPSSYFAAAVVRAALAARHGRVDQPEQEVRSIPDPTLSAWNRPAGPVDADAWRNSEVADARWCWLAALVLLGLEARMRRSRPAAQEERRAAA